MTLPPNLVDGWNALQMDSAAVEEGMEEGACAWELQASQGMRMLGAALLSCNLFIPN